MRNNFTIVLLVLVSALQSKTYSQSKHACKASIQNEIYFKNHPESRKEYVEFNNYSRKISKKQKSKLASTYTIPVVFHVYGETHNGYSVTTDKIKVALQKLNEDFQGLNADFADVDPLFNPIKSTLNIEFKLAQLDPNGNCTSGVIYYDEKSGYGGTGSNSAVAADAWNNYKYMNVYIQNDLYADGSTTNSGVAWYPNTSMSDNGIARVVYNGAYLHGNTGNEFASVLTHEFGHFLNLIHTFDGGCTYPNDEVDDTPAEDQSVVGSVCEPIQNCEGNFINYENYMGYNGAANGCYRMFTKGQTDRMLAALQHDARKTLWTAQNLIDTGVNNTGGSLAVNNNAVKELINNDGSFNQVIAITLDNVNFSTDSGSLTENSDYTLTLPQGLTSTLQINSLTTATLTITGTATSHLSANNETKNIIFNAAAFAGGANLACSSIGLDFKFYDPFEIIYENITDISATTGAAWDNLNLTLINGDNTYGTWVYVTKHLKIETYGKKLVTNTGTRDITLLEQGDLISTASNFTAPEDYPGQLDIRHDGYTAWEGKTGYIGFTTNHNGEIINGWMKASVSADGETITVYEYAFSTKPNGDITAGQTLIDPNAAQLLLTSNTASESASNNGNINFTTEINISGSAQFNNKTFINGVDFTTTTPNNYSIKVTYVNSTQVKLVIVGTATNHTEANNTSYNVTFNTPAFNNGFANIINHTNSVDIDFIDPYTIITGTLNESVDSASTWDWFSIPELDGAYYDYGAWYFGANHLKVETYGKKLVTNATTRNITLLENGELISSASNFTAPEAYPDQLDLYTSTHTDWSNRTGYIGFESQYKGKTVYGWLKVTVAANGTGYTVNEYAFYNKPESPIVAGSTTLPNAITWTGANDTSWNNPANWSTNAVPTSTSEVIIPANASMFPTINSPTTVSTVIIESRASLITNSELTATVTYNRNLATNNWYLVSSPLKNETITNLLDNNVFALGTGNNIGLAPYKNDGTAWNYQNANTLGTITSGKGYSVKLNLAADLKFTGTTNSTTVTYPVTINTNNYNLVGNPYTSYINLGDFFNANPLNTVVSEATAWIWNQATNSYDLKLAGIDDAFQIAPGQGFFISASANSNVTFDKANQSHVSGNFQRQAKSKTQINIIATSSDGATKTTKLYYLEGATTGFDNGYDGSTFKGIKSNFNFYSQLVNKENNKEYAIQSLPRENLETTVVPVGLEVNTNQTIVFSAESFNLPSDTQVYIEDKLNNKFINLSKEKYSVSLKKKTNTSGQFFIHTTSNKINNDVHILSNVSVYQSAKNQLTIKGLQTKNNLIKIYSAIGKTVMVKAFKSNGVTAINLPEISSGIYIVNVTSEGKKINKKVILSN